MNTSSFTQDMVDIINSYGLLQDRLAGDTLQLPVSWDKTKIKVNDFVLAETINYSLESLYKNWLYLLAYSVIPTNDIPNTSYLKYSIFDDGTGTRWKPVNDWSSSSSTGELSGMNHMLKISNSVDQNNFNMMISTTNQLMLLSGHEVYQQSDDVNSYDEPVPIIVNPDAVDSQGNIIRSKSSVTHPSNEILFENIKDMVVSDDKDLFVLDAIDDTVGHNIIFKFDISGITTLDDAILKNDTPGRLLTRTVGGVGAVTDKIKFDHPVCLLSVDNNLYVLDTDQNNRCVVKLFDSHLNWKQSFDLGVLTTGYVSDLDYNPGDDRFYVLSHVNGEPAKIHVYDSQFTSLYSSDLMNTEKHGDDLMYEKYIRVMFSVENDNIMYIVTDKSIFKKYVSRPDSFIGDFLFDTKLIGPVDIDRNIKDMIVFPVRVEETPGDFRVKDEIFVLEGSSDTLFRFVEDSGFETSLESDIESKFLSFDQLKIKPDENVDVIVYNKSLYKTLYNNLILLENTSRKFSTFFDSKGFSRYRGFQYLNEDELTQLRYTLSPDNYIAGNEIVLTETINRCLRKIYDLQLSIMNGMQEKSINVYPDPNQPVILN